MAKLNTAVLSDKVSSLFGSLRFWILTVTAVLAILQGWDANGGLVLKDVIETVQLWLLAVAGVGTLDSVAARIGVGLKK